MDMPDMPSEGIWRWERRVYPQKISNGQRWDNARPFLSVGRVLDPWQQLSGFCKGARMAVEFRVPTDIASARFLDVPPGSLTATQLSFVDAVRYAAESI